MVMKNLWKFPPEERSTGFPFLVLTVYLCSLCCGNFRDVQLSLPRISACAITPHLRLSLSALPCYLVTRPPFPHLSSSHQTLLRVFFATPSPILYLALSFGSITWPLRLVAVETSPNGAGYLPCYRSNWFPAGFQMSHSISLSLLSIIELKYAFLAALYSVGQKYSPENQ